jgi:uncharacterized protein (DUF305 family)
MKTTFGAALILAAAAIVPAIAQQTPPPPPAPVKGGITPSPAPMTISPPAADTSPSSKAFVAGDQKMMHGMMKPMTGDTDQDFVAGMIPHHQGAVDMAKVELQYGKDPEMRRLATDIVNSQEKQVSQMQAWQAKHTPAR